MALIRGAKGFCSCPWCLVPSKSTSDLSKSYALRDQDSSKKLIDMKNYTTAAAREEKLKEQGLRPVEVFLVHFSISIVIIFPRIYFGKSATLTHTGQYLGIAYMLFMVDFLGTTYGQK